MLSGCGAELASFWRLALAAGWQLERHYLFYPNPWPKPGQLQRRWHAHPVFPDLLRLGGRLEMRCNWELYAEEFAFAVNRLAGTKIEPVRLREPDPVSAFERKYHDSGHGLVFGYEGASLHLLIDIQHHEAGRCQLHDLRLAVPVTGLCRGCAGQRNPSL